jgi:SNF2 family DNA or RNA helicase
MKNLSVEVKNWLAQLKESHINQSSQNERKSKQVILYKLQHIQQNDISNFVIIPVSASIKKNGEFGNYKPYKYNPNSVAKYIKNIDYGILRKLYQESEYSYYSNEINYPLEGLEGSIILEEIINTGRCFWQQEENSIVGPILSLGKTRLAKVSCKINSNATQQFICKTKENHDYTIATIPCWYVDLSTNSCGKIETSINNDQLALLIKSPAINPDEIDLVNQELTPITVDDKNFTLPKKLPKAKIQDVRPTPCLHFTAKKILVQYYYQEIIVAELSFKYLGQKIAFNKLALKDEKKYLSVFKDNQLLKIFYDLKAHQEAEKLLEENGLINFSDAYNRTSGNLNVFLIKDNATGKHFISIEKQIINWKEFIQHKLQILRDKGFIITSDKDFPIALTSIIYPQEDWHATIESDLDSNDWFNFEIGVYANNKKISLLPILKNLLTSEPDIINNLERLKSGENVLIHTGPNEVVALPTDRVRQILLFLKDLYSFQNDNQFQLSKAEVFALADLQNNQELKWKDSEKWQELILKLKQGFKIEDVKEPEGLTVKLRHYQHEGMQWLNFLQENKFGGILADDMGLGKTIQTLAHIMLAKEQGILIKPVLIVSPTSVIFNWMHEIEKFTPSLKALLLHGNKRKTLLNNLSNYDIILTTYPLVLKDHAILEKEEFFIIVLDEAQYIKNVQSKVHQAITSLKSEYKICLTGTPMENHLGELWSLFNFVMPGFLGSKKQFQTYYRTPIEKEKDADRQRSLVVKIRPFILRRSKDDVLTELPEKTNITQYVELEEDQRDLYETIRVAVQTQLMQNIETNGLNKSQIAILDGLLKLRQVCCDPRLVSSDNVRKVKASAKLDMLKIMLSNMVEEGRKILLFSQFVTMLELIEDECNAMGIKYIKLTGASKNRDELVNQFQNTDVPLFLISLKAGGTGLNLTAADTVIQYDPWWNPAVEQQAASRAHRMGQQKPVFIYKLISKGTVEEKILAMQNKKQALADKLLENQGTISTKLEIEDVNILFSSIS